MRIRSWSKIGYSKNSQNPCNCEDAKNATVHLPPGFVGNPHATPQCTVAEFAANTCPIDSQVGIANVGVSVPGLSGIAIPFNTAIYNLIPPPEEAGLLGFKVFAFDTPVFTVLSARTGTDYGLDVNGTSIPHVWPLMYLQQVLWGVPAAPIHNRLALIPPIIHMAVRHMPASYVTQMKNEALTKATNQSSMSNLANWFSPAPLA